MRLSFGRRQFLAGTALAGIAAATGCGTILYPERRGQPGGRLDWGVVLLDGIGLILFFIPGVIAFAVDFASGAIYLPAEEHLQLSAAERSSGFKSIQVPAQPLSREEIAKAVTAEMGQSVTLDEGHYFTTELRDLDGFWPARDRLAATCTQESAAESEQAASS